MPAIDFAISSILQDHCKSHCTT